LIAEDILLYTGELSKMEKQSTKTRQSYLAISAIIIWFAVVCQFYLNVVNRSVPLFEVVVRFFSYFTILTNILVALCFTNLLLKPKSKLGEFFSQPVVLTAVTAYITFVGVAYNLLLRHLWNPKGLQLMVDELLHTIIPFLSVLHWLIFVPKAGLQWKSILPWTIYPVVYILCVTARGAFSGFYPYPFIDVSVLGYFKVLRNDIGLIGSFLLLSLLLVVIGKLMSKTFR
jgi:hypothetical protein